MKGFEGGILTEETLMAASPLQGSEKSPYHVPNLERALVIIELLAQEPAGLGQSEIAERLSIPRNSVYRITMTLMERGYFERNRSNKRFTLSRRFLALGYRVVQGQGLFEKALDVMHDLAQMSGETTLLGILLEEDGVVTHQVPGTHSFKFLADPGTRFRLHTSAQGKVLMACLPKEERERVLKRISLKRYNKRTITTKGDLRNELDLTRIREYGIDQAEEFEGVHCIAAPIMDNHGYPVAALWLVAPSDRIPEQDFDRIGRMVCEKARIVSARLGYGILTD
jgi:DNA-binding IclR family transcriptional regulator